LLSDRFKLTFHRETKNLPVYELVVAKNGPKFHESQSEGEPSFKPSNKMSLTVERMPMGQFADQISGPLRMPVVDMTGLKGRYDFTIDLSGYFNPDKPPTDPSEIIVPALQDILGLKLESKKAPIETIVVDHAEKVPSEN
jgi:uncharacterized protein (TIGR03435 family)